MVDQTTPPADRKRAARLAYYEGMRKAAEEQFKITENGLRNLDGVDAAKIDKIVADVHKRHEKLLRRIDGYIAKHTVPQR